MNSPSFLQRLLSNAGTTLLLVGAIALGSLLGAARPASGEALGAWVDPLILTLVCLLFFEVNLLALRRWREHARFLGIAWACNFIVIPTAGFLVAKLFLSGQPLLLTGLVIYFMAPCTDWFLGFTRMARGNVPLGAVLLPLNLVTQLLLFPLYLGLFAGEQVPHGPSSLLETLWAWCFRPFLGAAAAHLILRRLLPEAWFGKLLAAAGRAIPFFIAALVTCIFAANVGTILDHLGAFALILAAVFVFFVLTWFLAEGMGRLFRLPYPNHALLTMTTAARNAPLVLGLTMAALPDQPLIYAALVIGMLVEFPHLTVLKHLLLRRKDHPPATGMSPVRPTMETA